eukprot:SAG31_NODE_1031_length_10234_cov_6.100049_2_plen_90_part_00
MLSPFAPAERTLHAECGGSGSGPAETSRPNRAETAAAAVLIARARVKAARRARAEARQRFYYIIRGPLQPYDGVRTAVLVAFSGRRVHV